MKRRIRAIAATAALFSVGVFAGNASAAPGQIDPTFGDKGRTLVDGPPQPTFSYPRAMVSLGDGNKLTVETVGFRRQRSVLVKRGPDGSPVDSFGVGGSILIPQVQGSTFDASRLAIQGDSVITLSSGNGVWPMSQAIHRFDLTSGKWDRSFGDGGVLMVSRDDVITDENRNPRFFAFGLSVDQAGRIYFGAGEGARGDPAAIFRLEADGDLDQSFGENGAVVSLVAQCWFAKGITVTGDGTFYYSDSCIWRIGETGELTRLYKARDIPTDRDVTTMVGTDDGHTYFGVDEDDDKMVRIMEIGPGDAIAPAFGVDGSIPSFPADPYFSPEHLVVDDEGRFLITGRPDADHADPNREVVRLTPDGLPDPTFGTDGISILEPAGMPDRVDINVATPVPGGLIMIAFSNRSYHPSYFGMGFKVLDDGSQDMAYGGDGLLDFSAVAPPDDEFNDTLALVGGGTLVAGRSENLATFHRFGPKGKLDRTFGSGGTLTITDTTPASADAAKFLAPMENGDFVACLESGKSAKVARVLPDGSPDPEFGSNGSGTVAIEDIRKCKSIASDGKWIFVAGTYSNNSPVVTRLAGDGSLDTTYGDNGRYHPFGINSYPISDFAFTILPGGGNLSATNGEIAKGTPGGERAKRFGNQGVVKLAGGYRTTPMRWAAAITRNPAGDIYVAGHSTGNPVVFKLKPNGKRFWKFGLRGVKVLRNEGLKVQIRDAKTQPGGRLLLAGPAWDRDCFVSCGFARAYRLKADGTVDRSFSGDGIFHRRFGSNSTASSLRSKSVV